MSNKLLEQSIVKTLSYFDLFDHPLTKEELYNYLWQPPVVGYGEFLEMVSDIHDSKHGYYFLPNRQEIVEIRRKKLIAVEEKMKKAFKAAKKIRSVPFLRAIFVCNTVASEQADAESDIDFFIITKTKRIWLTRFFTNLILRLSGLRSYGNRIKNKVCLSFYVDSENLNLSDLRICNEDVYLIYWLHQLVPIYDPDNFHEKLLLANQWTKKYLFNINNKQILSTHRFRVDNSKIGLYWKKIWEKMWKGAYGNIVEAQAKAIQWSKLKLSLKEKAKTDDKSVVIKEGMLKFHENDRRTHYFEAWKSKIVSS